MLSILDLLRSDSFISVPKPLAKAIGLNETVILMELLTIRNYHLKELDDEGMFYCTIDKLEENTSLKRKAQDTAIKKLQELDLIYVKQKGLPAKRHFYINEKAILELFMECRTNKNVPKGQTGNNNAETTYPQEKSRSNQVVPKGQTRTSQTDKPDCSKRTTNNNYNNNYLKDNLSEQEFPFYNWLEEE